MNLPVLEQWMPSNTAAEVLAQLLYSLTPAQTDEPLQQAEETKEIELNTEQQVELVDEGDDKPVVSMANHNMMSVVTQAINDQ